MIVYYETTYEYVSVTPWLRVLIRQHHEVPDFFTNFSGEYNCYGANVILSFNKVEVNFENQ